MARGQRIDAMRRMPADLLDIIRPERAVKDMHTYVDEHLPRPVLALGSTRRRWWTPRRPRCDHRRRPRAGADAVEAAAESVGPLCGPGQQAERRIETSNTQIRARSGFGSFSPRSFRTWRRTAHRQGRVGRAQPRPLGEQVWDDGSNKWSVCLGAVMPRRRLTNEWSIDLNDSFRGRVVDGDLQLISPGPPARTIWITVWQTAPDLSTAHLLEQILQDVHPNPTWKVREDGADRDELRYASWYPEIDNGREQWGLYAYTLRPGSYVQAALLTDKPADPNWALTTWRSLRFQAATH
jgi:hypothetical protein